MLQIAGVVLAMAMIGVNVNLKWKANGMEEAGSREDIHWWPAGWMDNTRSPLRSWLGDQAHSSGRAPATLATMHRIGQRKKKNSRRELAPEWRLARSGKNRCVRRPDGERRWRPTRVRSWLPRPRESKSARAPALVPPNQQRRDERGHAQCRSVVDAPARTGARTTAGRDEAEGGWRGRCRRRRKDGELGVKAGTA